MSPRKGVARWYIQRGRIVFTLWWEGRRWKLYTGLVATDANRSRADEQALAIQWHIAHGSFDPKTAFPDDPKFRAPVPTKPPRAETELASTYLRRWHASRSPFRPDGSVIEDPDVYPTTWLHDVSTIKRLSTRFADTAIADITPTLCIEFKRELQDAGLEGKTVTNILGLLHTAMEDAVWVYRLIDRNPVPRLRSKRRTKADKRKQSKPLRNDEVDTILRTLPKTVEMTDGAVVDRKVLSDLYSVWFRTGWRSNEICALRLDWLDWRRQVAHLRKGRSPRNGGLEAPPKTGAREVDCSYDPEIFAAFERRRRSSIETGKRDFVFADSKGRPISQEWLAKRVWNPTLRRIGLAHRGQYNIRDTFITLALSAGEDPGWVAEVCGTSEEMIWRHYRSWMPSLDRGHGRRIAGVFGGGSRARLVPAKRPAGSKSQRDQYVESGGGGNRTPVRK